MRNKIQEISRQRAKVPPSAPLGKQLTFPDLITLINLAAGFGAILFAFAGKTTAAIGCILIAVALDVFDGRIARKWQVVHELGKNLDSLADFVSFGIAPAMLLFSVFGGAVPGIAFPLLLFVLCGALRLARFNILTTPEMFLGIPITTNGILIPMVVDLNIPLAFAIAITILSAALMVSSIPIKKKMMGSIGTALVAIWIILRVI